MPSSMAAEMPMPTPAQAREQLGAGSYMDPSKPGECQAVWQAMVMRQMVAVLRG